MKILKRFIIPILIASLLTAGFCLNASAMVVFDGDFGFEVNASTHTAKLAKYSGSSETVRLPAYFRDYPVTTIDRKAFSGNTNIRELVFASTNTTVEEYAFMNCTSLETVYIPENVTDFGDRVFANCTSLTTVTVLSDIVSLPTNLFSGCTALTDVTLNPAIAEFGYGCFNGCSSLSDLSFVSNGALLQSYAFNGTGAASVELSASLLAIPNNAFTNCANLEYVTIPESVILIQPNAFDFEHITIRCYYDSYAYSFAVENDVPYELLDNVMLGDTNRDGKVNISDVTCIQRHLAEVERIEGIRLKAANINGDEKIDIMDATDLQMYLAEYEIEYPIREIIRH